jgi:hypothetical protein
MTRLLIHVEGQTEETVVNEVLRQHLLSAGFHDVGARLVGNARLRSRRGGVRGWDSFRGDIVRQLRQDTSCYVSTMVDYYGMPQSGQRAWPGRQGAAAEPFALRAAAVEDALSVDIQAQMGPSFDSRRFIPFVIIHEFEGLLFSDCAAFSRGIGRPELEAALRRIRDQFASPEEINDSPDSAPSKRLEQLIPGYEKPLLGTLAVIEIGLASIRAQCHHFNHWLQRLEAIVTQ